MKVNGQEKQLLSEISLQDYLLAENYKLEHIAVELNHQIIRKENYASAMLNNDSILEIVKFMGGG